MYDVFVSHVEEDAKIALQLVHAFRGHSYSTWIYEEDSLPGEPYPVQVARAIQDSRVVCILISPDSLGSQQVSNELVLAYETGKGFLPVLVGISHIQFQNRRPDWRVMLGAATSVAVPADGDVGEIEGRIVAGLARVLQRDPNPPRMRETSPAILPLPHPRTKWLPGRRSLLASGGIVLSAAAGLLIHRYYPAIEEGFDWRLPSSRKFSGSNEFVPDDAAVVVVGVLLGGIVSHAEKIPDELLIRLRPPLEQSGLSEAVIRSFFGEIENAQQVAAKSDLANILARAVSIVIDAVRSQHAEHRDAYLTIGLHLSMHLNLLLGLHDSPAPSTLLKNEIYDNFPGKLRDMFQTPSRTPIPKPLWGLLDFGEVYLVRAEQREVCIARLCLFLNYLWQFWQGISPLPADPVDLSTEQSKSMARGMLDRLRRMGVVRLSR